VGKFDVLNSPIKLGPVEIKNRFFVAPMNETFAQAAGDVGQQYISYFAARAKGGYGLIITGAIMATKLASKYVWGRNPYLFSPLHQQGLHMFTETMHHFDAQVMAQMTIGFGRQGHSDNHHDLVPAPTAGLPYEIAVEKTNTPLIDENYRKKEAPRAFLVGQNTYEMSIDLIHSEQKEYARSIQLAGGAGFDGIEIHGPHGYLEHEFLSPFSNKRTDMYGGSWRNRKRFMLEVAEQTRYAAGSNICVGIRISAEEHMEGGLTREEMLDLAQDCEKVGLDYISLSDGGGYEETAHLNPDFDRYKHLPETAEFFKKGLKIPVLLPSIHEPEECLDLIASGQSDMVGHGRQSFIDPQYPNKIAAGKPEDIKVCKRCNFCLAKALSGGGGPRCPHNPELGREYANPAYNIGLRKVGEPIMPRADDMPALERPWWKKELPYTEKCSRPFRGPGPK
jgi:2,4-dienoyl-CoA reductase-like NADH-dependent reductase (Old Yellow Enzyme family)